MYILMAVFDSNIRIFHTVNIILLYKVCIILYIIYNDIVVI